MAFPTIADATPTKTNGSGTSATIDLPPTQDVGDLIVVLIGTDGDNTFSWASPFSEIVEGADTKDIAISAGAWISDGTDGGTVVVSLGSNEKWAAMAYRITAGTHGTGYRWNSI